MELHTFIHLYSRISDEVTCTVCRCRFQNHIVMCTRGHNICITCFAKLEPSRCPMCNLLYTYQVRNKALEKISNVMHNTIYANEDGTVDRKEKTWEPPQCKGYYQCRINYCSRSLPICRLLNHIRSYHLKKLSVVRKDNLCSHEYAAIFRGSCETTSRAIQIWNFGLFFLNVDISFNATEKKIRIWLQLAANRRAIKDVLYTLKLTYKEKYLAKFIAIPHSCRQNPKSIVRLGRCLVLNVPLEASIPMAPQEVQVPDMELCLIIEENRATRRPSYFTEISQLQ